MAIVIPEDTTQVGNPPPDVEPPIVRVLFPRRGVVRFVRGEVGGISSGFGVEVWDVRGRRVWRGEGAGSTRALDWRTADGESGRVPAGVYFARVSVGGTTVARGLKVVVLP
jgi:hypothetical protein